MKVTLTFIHSYLRGIPYEGKNEGKTFNERMNIEGKSYGYLFNITY